VFHPRLALASLSGEADAEWAANGAEWAGAAFLGGICLDDPTREAAREMVADRDRTEFLPDDPIAFVDDELAAISATTTPSSRSTPTAGRTNSVRPARARHCSGSPTDSNRWSGQQRSRAPT